jgi:hypothetical protein
MRSHTVPQRLLKQFAYEDLTTKSLRLWRYSKGKPPYPRASPKTATRIDGYFAVPTDERIEAQVETRLAREIEDPVNGFLADFADSNFAMTKIQRERMTRYIALLFHRSISRRSAGSHIQEIKAQALQAFLSNESQLTTVAVHWGLNAHFKGLTLPPITSKDVEQAARKMLDGISSASTRQEAFVTGLVGAVAVLDEPMFRGEWRVLRTTPDEPFILSDAPVVTWQRLETGMLSYGVGFHTDNVEVVFPVSPIACLHILPTVQRTRPPLEPKVLEINGAQAAYASEACFANQNRQQIDDIVQKCAGQVQMGRNAFTLRHRNYNNLVYDLLMQQ